MCDRHEFRFEFDKAFNAQLILKFEESPPHALAEDIGADTKGVYALYWKGKIVYAGKAMENTTLKRRLREHFKKISGRRGISEKEVTCRLLSIESDWFVRAAEEALIGHYNPPWQTSGFGRHDPGRGRSGVKTHGPADERGVKPSKWEADFPKK